METLIRIIELLFQTVIFCIFEIICFENGMDTLTIDRIVFWVIIIGAILLFYAIVHVACCVCRMVHGKCRKEEGEPRLSGVGKQQGVQRDQPGAEGVSSEPQERRKPKRKRRREEIEGESDSAAVRAVLPQNDPSRTAVHLTFLNQQLQTVSKCSNQRSFYIFLLEQNSNYCSDVIASPPF